MLNESLDKLLGEYRQAQHLFISNPDKINDLAIAMYNQESVVKEEAKREVLTAELIKLLTGHEVKYRLVTGEDDALHIYSKDVKGDGVKWKA